MSPAQPRLLIDPYLDWVAAEGLPVHEDFGVDLLAAETAPWPRLGERCNGAFVHLKGRGDWMTVFLLEIRRAGSRRRSSICSTNCSTCSPAAAAP